MKRSVFFMVAIVTMTVCLSCATGSNNARYVPIVPEVEGDFKYIVETNGAIQTVKITGYVGRSNEDVTIPATIKDIPVTCIGRAAFYNQNHKGVTIPESVVTIEEKAFYGNRIKEVIIPEGVTTIGDRAFEWPDASFKDVEFTLAKVTIPESVTSVGYAAFGDLPVFNLHDGKPNPNIKISGTYERREKLWYRDGIALPELARLNFPVSSDGYPYITDIDGKKDISEYSSNDNIYLQPGQYTIGVGYYNNQNNPPRRKIATLKDLTIESGTYDFLVLREFLKGNSNLVVSKRKE